MSTKIAISIFIGLAGAVLEIQPAVGQGSLTPPGPPGATMLTLSQVEPRTPVDSEHTGSGGSAEFLITQPGSYYLTTNIVGVSGEHGINISANNVTLDLNGFSLQGISSAYDAIYIHSDYTNITVRNGQISGWSNTGAYGHGIECLANNVIFEKLNIANCASNGVYAANAAQISNVQVYGERTTGIVAGPGSVVENSSASGNAGFGFLAGNNSILRECSAEGNTNTGIYAFFSSNCVIQDCVSSGNGSGYLYSADGISVGNGGTVLGCSVANNSSNGITAGNGCLIEHCTATANGNPSYPNDEIFAGNNCVIAHCVAVAYDQDPEGIYCMGGLVSDCSVSGAYDGIFCVNPSVVKDCQLENNEDAGILVYGTGSQVIGNTCNGGLNGVAVNANQCRIERNQVAGCDYGISCDGTTNVIVLNSVEGSADDNYFIPSGNDVAPIGTAATATSPFANISH